MDKARRKELKALAAQVEIPMGVVKVTNTENDKIFVAAYPDLRNQWDAIRSRLDQGLFSSGALIRDWRAFGPEAFAYEVLEEQPQGPESPEERRHLLNKMEREWREKLQPYGDAGYNRPTAW